MDIYRGRRQVVSVADTINTSTAGDYTVPLGSWDSMRDGLLLRLVDDAGSIRKASAALSVPLATLSQRVARARKRTTVRELEARLAELLGPL